jgi:imidazolonepropionase
VADLLVRGIGQLVTNDTGGGGLVGLIEDAAVVVTDSAVAWVGSGAALPPDLPDMPELNCQGRAVVPGFVDAHTHLVFAGDRSIEFGLRMEGATYEELLAAGGGIRSTVRMTHEAGDDELFSASRSRAERMLRAGTTTAEVKSGYGLDVATEVRILETVRRLDAALPIDLVPTFLGAHVVPAEFVDDRSAYVALVAGDMLEACAPLARFCDVFSDDVAFNVAETRTILTAAAERGLAARIHADQLSRSGGTALAAELGAASADHLDHATEEDLAALAAAGTSAVLLPAVSLAMRLPYPSGRTIWDSGVTVALGTDCNPGSAYVETMSFVMALAVLEMGLTPDEALWAATRGSALSLREPDKGRLGAGSRADLVVLDADSHVHIPYRPDTDLAWTVVKDGNIVAGPSGP